MTDFLSAEWLSALNDSLKAAGPAPLEDPTSEFRVVIEFADAPANVPRALTFSVSASGTAVEVGEHRDANAVIRLDYADADALTRGTLDSASALREGRLKIRGDVHGLVPLLSWLQFSK